jgi:hypothetical protein
MGHVGYGVDAGEMRWFLDCALRASFGMTLHFDERL